MADGLPALGIVAAVLGVIKTMGAITEPPEVLGAMIGGALVGTFLGVFLAYGLVGPMADADEGRGRRGSAASTASSRRCWWPTCTATRRRSRWRSAAATCPSAAQPSFLELEEALGAIPPEAAEPHRLGRRREK